MRGAGQTDVACIGAVHEGGSSAARLGGWWRARHFATWPGELDLATQEGAYSITLGDGCDWVRPDFEILRYPGETAAILSRLDDGDARCFLTDQVLVDRSPATKDTSEQCDGTPTPIGALHEYARGLEDDDCRE